MQKKTNLLTALIIAGLALGVLIGHFFLWDSTATPEKIAEVTGGWKTAGELVLIRPLKLITIPLIFTSVMVGITSVGDARKLGVIGVATLVFYLLTMVLAVGTGVTLGATIKPGDGIPPEVIAQAQSTGAAVVAERGQDVAAGGGLGAAWINILRLMIPENFVDAAASGRALSIITATIVLAIGLLLAGKEGEPFIRVVQSLHEALMIIVRFILWLMPIGVLLLVAWAVGSMGLKNLAGALAAYVVTVIAGLGVHMFIALPLVLFIATRVNPYKFMWSIRSALFTAFGTSSSMATLPVTIEATSDLGGCSKRSSGIVLPLGATVNMDGTALYQGIAVIFMFQAFGYDLGFAQYLVIVLTATLAAVGAAGVPGGSLVTTLIIINAVNTTLAGVDDVDPLPLAAIGLVIGVDRILDMCRTTVNVWGDSVGARIITRIAPDTPEEREKAFA